MAPSPSPIPLAQRLRAGVEAGIADGSISGVAFSQPTQSNGVFATLPDGVVDEIAAATLESQGPDGSALLVAHGPALRPKVTT